MGWVAASSGPALLIYLHNPPSMQLGLDSQVYCFHTNDFNLASTPWRSWEGGYWCTKSYHWQKSCMGSRMVLTPTLGMFMGIVPPLCLGCLCLPAGAALSFLANRFENQSSFCSPTCPLVHFSFPRRWLALAASAFKTFSALGPPGQRGGFPRRIQPKSFCHTGKEGCDNSIKPILRRGAEPTSPEHLE